MSAELNPLVPFARSGSESHALALTSLNKDPTCHIATLPVELLTRIFSGIKYTDLFNANRVCRDWYQIMRDPNLHSQLLSQNIRENSSLTWTNVDCIFKSAKLIDRGLHPSHTDHSPYAPYTQFPMKEFHRISECPYRMVLNERGQYLIPLLPEGEHSNDTLFFQDKESLFISEVDGSIQHFHLSANARPLNSGESTLSKMVQTFKGHSEKANVISLERIQTEEASNGSKDQKILVSGSEDKTIKTWNIETGECLQTLHGHDAGVIALHMNAGGRLISGDRSNFIRIWNTATGECQAAINYSDLLRDMDCGVTPIRGFASSQNILYIYNHRTVGVFLLQNGENKLLKVIQLEKEDFILSTKANRNCLSISYCKSANGLRDSHYVYHIDCFFKSDSLLDCLENFARGFENCLDSMEDEAPKPLITSFKNLDKRVKSAIYQHFDALLSSPNSFNGFTSQEYRDFNYSSSPGSGKKNFLHLLDRDASRKRIRLLARAAAIRKFIAEAKAPKIAPQLSLTANRESRNGLVGLFSNLNLSNVVKMFF